MSLQLRLLVSAAFLLSCVQRETRPDGALGFQQYVLGVLAEAFPEESFLAGGTSELIRHDDAELGLQNLRARVRSLTEAEKREAVIEHFNGALAAVEQAVERELGWSEAKPPLRPQIAPAEYANSTPMANEPFAGSLVRAIAIDLPDVYQYAKEEDLRRWGVTFAEAAAIAIENLEAASQDLEYSGTEGADLFLAVQTRDGYDAARLLLPSVQEFAASYLGSPFLAAIPNRDFLIMWSPSASSAFQEHFRREVAEDFATEPYPLSGRIFEIAGGLVREISD